MSKVMHFLFMDSYENDNDKYTIINNINLFTEEKEEKIIKNLIKIKKEDEFPLPKSGLINLTKWHAEKKEHDKKIRAKYEAEKQTKKTTKTKIIINTATESIEEIISENIEEIINEKIEETATESTEEIISENIEEIFENEIFFIPESIMAAPVFDTEIEFLTSLNQSRNKINKILLDEKLYEKYLSTHKNTGFYELIKNKKFVKIFFDFDDIENGNALNTIINKIKKFFNSLHFPAAELLIQSRESNGKIKAHIITQNLYAEKKEISIFQKLMNKMKILGPVEIDYHAVNHDQFRNSYWAKKSKYDLTAEKNTAIMAENIDDVLHSFVSLIYGEMADVTKAMKNFNDKNGHLLINMMAAAATTNEIYCAEIDNVKKTIAEYLEQVNNIKIDPRRIFFNTLADGKKYLMRQDFYPNKKSTEEIFLTKDRSGESLTKGAPILFNKTENGFSLVSMYAADDSQKVTFTNKKTHKNTNIIDELNKEWPAEENLINFDEAELKWGTFNLIESKPGGGKSTLAVNHMAGEKTKTKVIIETRLSQRITHKNMILNVDPEAKIIEIDGQNKAGDQFYIDHILEENCWFIVNDLSFYQRFKRYFIEALMMRPEMKIIILMDEAFQIFNNLTTNNNCLFKAVDLKYEFMDFIENYAETWYATDLTKMGELKKLIKKNFDTAPEFNEVKLRSRQTIKKITLKNDMMFFMRKMLKCYFDGKKILAYFDTVRDLQAVYAWLIKKFINLDDIIQITGEHENAAEFKILNEKKIVLTTSKIFNCISIDCADNDETFLFTSNQKMINNYNKLNSCMRQRKSKFLNICIDKLGLLLVHNDYKKIGPLLKHNKVYFNYLNEYDSMTMIDAIKLIINRGADFEIENLIDDEKYKIKKEIIVRLNGEKNTEQEKILNLATDKYRGEIDDFNEAKKLICDDKTRAEVKKIIEAVKIDDLDKKLNYLTNNKAPDEIEKMGLIDRIKRQEIINTKKEFLLKSMAEIKKDLGEEKIDELRNFVRKNNLNMNTLEYEIKQGVIEEFNDSIRGKNGGKLTELMNTHKRDFLIWRDNELIEKNLKKDYLVVFDESLTEEKYGRDKTREIIKRHKTDRNHKEIIIIGYDLVRNEHREFTLIKNGSKYHLVIYENNFSLN